MSKYYILSCHPPLHSEHYRIRVPYPASGLRWEEGVLFTINDYREGFHPPSLPIEIQVEEEAIEPPRRILPELYWNPIPLMSRRLVIALAEAGVNNLQTFDTRLVGKKKLICSMADNYLAVNIVGLVAAADLQQTKINQEVPDRLISMDIHSLTVGSEKAKGFLLFRLAENVTAVLVHDRVRLAVEASGITSLTWFNTEAWAG